MVLHEHIDIVIHDDEFAAIVDECGARLILDEAAISVMAAVASIKPPKHPGSIVMLTSRTTGRPEGTRVPATRQASRAS